jgi:mRNA interferase MazF
MESASALRVELEPSARNGLRIPSQVMVEKVVTVRASRIAGVIGRLDEHQLTQVNRTLAFVLGLAE